MVLPIWVLLISISMLRQDFAGRVSERAKGSASAKLSFEVDTGKCLGDRCAGLPAV